MDSSAYYFSCISVFVQDCREFFLHDLSLPLLKYPRVFDDFVSRDQDDSERQAKQNYLRYLEASIEVLSFMGHYSKMTEFSEMLERSTDLFKSERKDAMLDVFKGGDGFTESPTPALVQTVIALQSLKDKEFKDMHKMTAKLMNSNTGAPERLINAFTAKNSEAELFAEIKKVNQKLILLTTTPTEELFTEIMSSHVGIRYGLEWTLLQRVYLRDLKTVSDNARQVYSNHKARKLFSGQEKDLSQVQNIMLKACLVYFAN